jgi:antitoxin PrlF
LLPTARLDEMLDCRWSAARSRSRQDLTLVFILAQVMHSHYLSLMAAILEAEAKLTSQNQISIPASIRKALGLRAGQSRIVFHVLKGGKVFVSSAKSPVARHEDPALRPFLALLEKDMAEQPNLIKPFPGKLFSRAQAAVKGLKVDLEGPLTGQD